MVVDRFLEGLEEKAKILGIYQISVLGKSFRRLWYGGCRQKEQLGTFPFSQENVDEVNVVNSGH
jgi:hypothetical protein